MADDRAKALITARQEEDATGRLAELEEQFVQKLDESDRYKQEAEALKQVVSCFKQACDAKGITPDFPAALAPLVQRLYADQGASGGGGAAAGGAAADGALPKDGSAFPPPPHPTRPPPHCARASTQFLGRIDPRAASRGARAGVAQRNHVGRRRLARERHEGVGAAHI